MCLHRYLLFVNAEPVDGLKPSVKFDVLHPTLQNAVAPRKVILDEVLA